MKIKLIYLAMIFVLVACSNNNTNNSKQIKAKEPEQIGAKRPEQIGKIVFGILKEINTGSKADYVANFILVEEIKKLAKDTNHESLNNLSSMSQEFLINYLEMEYKEIKDKGEELSINWDNIEYLGFQYLIRNNEGIKSCEGNLYFKCNDRSFWIKSGSLFNGKKYRLLKVGELNETEILPVFNNR